MSHPRHATRPSFLARCLRIAGRVLRALVVGTAVGPAAPPPPPPPPAPQGTQQEAEDEAR
ncbi:MAG: hypothetical protein IT373_29900 [Polyangiaceae bacterium]|nr:hypothetical protein [Polyangiaceae bacterium]